MDQVHEKDVLKCSIEVHGELCVMTDSLMHQRESFVSCWDTGRSLPFMDLVTLLLLSSSSSLFVQNIT